MLSTTVASLLLPGAGQALNRQAIKGMLWFLLAALAFWQIRHLAGVPFIALWLLGGVDAQRIAGRLNRGETVSPWQCF